MTLARLFQEHAAPAASLALVAHPILDAELRRLHTEGQAAWPQIELTAEQLTLFLARQLPPEATEPEALADLRGSELYLICAFNLGQPAAQMILQRDYMPAVRRVLMERGISESLIADIQQDLCGRLIEKQDPAIVRQGYSGRGALAAWLRTVAVREAELRRKRGQRELGLDFEAESMLRDPHKSPESALVAGSLKQAFHAAFREAVAALSSRERNLLRYHFLLRHSIDQIGDIYRVHRSTAARWVARAEEHLIAETRERFAQRAEVREQSLPNVMEELRSQLSINLGSMLRSAAEGEPSKV